jgi:hypothetical protein
MSQSINPSWGSAGLRAAAYATVSAQASAPAAPLVEPIVLVDGVPEPRLRVTALTRSAPLDMSEVVVEVESTLSMDRLAAACAVIVAQAHRLQDGQVRWRVLARGQGFHRTQTQTSVGKDQRQWMLRDAWSAVLERGLGRLWRMNRAGALAIEDGPAWLEPGVHGNRSALRAHIQGRSVFVLQTSGGPWTVGQALELVGAGIGVTPRFGLEASRVLTTPLAERIDLTRSVGQVLEQLLTPLGLTLRRRWERIGPHTRETLAVVGVRDGRRIKPLPASVRNPLSDLQRLQVHGRSAAAVAWTAQAKGWLVESTFVLVAGWSPLREGLPDAAYRRSGNTTFAQVADVYRRWSLNEHGRFSVEPFNRGPAFDLGGLFGGTIAPQARRLEPMLTVDDGGRRREPFIEVSLDSGATWTAYDGSAQVLVDEASIYFDDATLPIDYFNAAKLGLARVRVTAGLRSPAPVEVTRWRGNAFAGAEPPQVLAAPKGFLFQKVDAASINFNQVRSGEWRALEADDRLKLDAWLMRQMTTEQASVPMSALGNSLSRLSLQLAGDWSDIQPGDRIAVGSWTGGGATADHEARVQRVRTSWGGARAGDPSTGLDLTFAGI